MRYPLPGPRRSSHARKTLAKTKHAVIEGVRDKELDKLMLNRTKAESQITSAGITELEHHARREAMSPLSKLAEAKTEHRNKVWVI